MTHRLANRASRPPAKRSSRAASEELTRSERLSWGEQRSKAFDTNRLDAVSPEGAPPSPLTLSSPRGILPYPLSPLPLVVMKHCPMQIPLPPAISTPVPLCALSLTRAALHATCLPSAQEQSHVLSYLCLLNMLVHFMLSTVEHILSTFLSHSIC